MVGGMNLRERLSAALNGLYSGPPPTLGSHNKLLDAMEAAVPDPDAPAPPTPPEPACLQAAATLIASAAVRGSEVPLEVHTHHIAEQVVPLASAIQARLDALRRPDYAHRDSVSQAVLRERDWIVEFLRSTSERHGKSAALDAINALADLISRGAHLVGYRKPR